jgi:NitT/TauT family transport system substrate-binding protein
MRIGWWGALLALALACQAAPGGPTGGVAPAAPAASSGGAAPVATSSVPASGGAQGGGAAASAPAAAQPTPATARTLGFALSAISPAVAPVWVGAEQGLFRRHGVELELVSMSPASTNQALTAGSVAFSSGGGSSVTAMVGGASDLVFVAGLMNKAHFKIVARPEIARFEDLRGKAAGSTSAGSGASIALYEALRRNGLEPTRDVEITYLRETPNVVAGLLAGVVHGAALAPPFSEQVQTQGARLLMDLREHDIPLTGNNITTTRTFLAREPELSRQFLMGYIEAIQFARDHRAESIEAIVRGTRNEDRAEAESAYGIFRDMWSPWPSEAAIQTILNNLDEPGAKSARPADMIDDRILRELERSGWLAEHYRGS